MARTKPHVLFLGEKWCDCNLSCGVSNAEHIFWGSLEASGLGTSEKFHYDEYRQTFNAPADAALIKQCRESKPDLLFFTWMHTDEEGWNPTFETLYTIRKTLGIPLVAWWGDIHNPVQIATAEAIAPLVDKHIFPEPVEPFHPYPKRREKYITLPHPKDPRLFYDPHLIRDIPVSFTGGIEGRPHRISLLKFLNEQGIKVYKDGGQREHGLKIEEYANVFMRSRIALNFCDYPIPIANGRCFEATLCGSLLMDHESSRASLWFIPGEEYVTYTDGPDLAAKIKYYLENPESARAIAERGRIKALRNHDGRVFWEGVFRCVREESAYQLQDATLALIAKRVRNGEFEAALDEIYRHLAQFPSSSECHYWLSQIFINQENYSEAENILTKAIADPAHREEAALNLAKIFLKQKRASDANEIIKNMIGQPDCSIQAKAYFCELLLECEENERAAALNIEMLEKYPKEPKVYVAICKTLIKSKDYSKIQSLLTISPPQVFYELNRLLAEHFETVGQYESAAQHRWVAANPSSFDYRYGIPISQVPFMANVMCLRGERKKAIEMLQDALTFRRDLRWSALLKKLSAPAGQQLSF